MIAVSNSVYGAIPMQFASRRHSGTPVASHSVRSDRERQPLRTIGPDLRQLLFRPCHGQT